MSARPVVVGIDGSADARRALLLAGDYARRLNSPLCIIHAVGLTERIDGVTVPSHGHEGEIADRFAAWCEAVRDAGVDSWDARLVDGSPVDTILRTAQELEAALIVVGRHGSGQRPERLLGSTAHQVAERSRCPVVIVPPIGWSERPDT